MAEPLASHARFRTHRADEAQSEAARVLSAHELRLRRGAPLDARLNAAAHGPIVLCWMDYGAEVEVRAPELGDYVAVNMPIAGSMLVAHRGREFVADARTAAVFSQSGDLRMRYGADLRQFIVRVDTAALVEQLVALAPDAPADAPRFAPTMDLAGLAAAFGGAVRLLQDLLERDPQRVPPTAGDRVAEMLLTALLLGQPGSHSAALRVAPAPATARTVRRAREFIDARPDGVTTVREIADAAGVGIRSLQQAFRVQLGESPTAYEQRMRLTRAHAALRAADPGDGTTVTEVALRFGFAHTGRFAAAYARRYGRPPSATLRG